MASPHGGALVPPHRRKGGAPDPNYELRPNKFTVAMHHGGFFCGIGTNRAYIDGKLDFFDECDNQTWSQDSIDDMLNQLGYPVSWLEHIYWLEPGYDMAHGLRTMNFERDAKKMAESSLYCKTQKLFVDHVDLLRAKELPDDVMEETVPGLPSVMVSPIKKKSRRGATTGNEEIKEEVVPDEEVKKADSDINDSDYDFEDGEEESDAFEDDSDYKKNIDADVEDGQLGKKEANHVWPDDGVPEDDYLEPLPAEDDLLKSFKPRIFNPEVDMENPIFKLAMAFSTMQEVRNAVAQYSVKNRVQVKKKRNNSVRLEAHCAEGCTWQLVISWDNRTEKFLVKEYVGEHSCESVWNVKEMTYLWLANRYVEFFRDNESVSTKTFGKHVQAELNILPSRFKLAKAKYAALEVIHGDEKMQYNNLWDYGEELRNRNPGTSFYLKTIGNPGIFSTCYFSLDACKRGFLKGCRPVICLDGTHIKNKYGGQLLTAVAIDGNDGIFPIAMAVVEVECYSSWKWFLTTLKDDLNIINTSPFTIMSDKQKGLIKAVMEVWVDSEHRFCVRHLWSNLNQHGWKGETLKNHLWSCARSTTVPQWERNMEKMKNDCPAAHAFLEQIPPNTWCRAFFSDFSMCDLLLNNACEVWNKMILDARELCILAMWEQIRCIIMNRFFEKLKEASEKWVGTICPKIRQKVRKNTDFAAKCTATHAPVQGMGVFEVISNQRSYIVELNMRSCTCRRWQLTGIPCSHVISCLRLERIRPDMMVASCYKLETYVEAYNCNIYPVSDRSEWTKTNGPDILPPFYEKKVGRPKRCRRKNPEELADGTKLSRHGLKMHCGYCRDPNHTRRNCTKLKEDVARELGEHGEEHVADHVHEEAPARQEVDPSIEEENEEAHDQQQLDPSIEEEHEEALDQPKTSKRKRKASLKVREQEEVERIYAQMRKKAKVVDENGDIDDPTILEHIIPKHLVHSHDPSHLKSTLVYKMQHNVPTRAAVQQKEMPESSFVVQHREQIPGPGRSITALAAWRATTTGQAAASRVATRGRGRGRARNRGRGKGRGGARGAPYWLRGEGGTSTSRNVEEYQDVEVNTTQNAPVSDRSDEN